MKIGYNNISIICIVKKILELNKSELCIIIIPSNFGIHHAFITLKKYNFKIVRVPNNHISLLVIEKATEQNINNLIIIL